MPKLRWMPEHSMQTKMPRFKEAQSGSVCKVFFSGKSCFFECGVVFMSGFFGEVFFEGGGCFGGKDGVVESILREGVGAQVAVVEVGGGLKDHYWERHSRRRSGCQQSI